jgi:hypothetical protein
MSLKQIVMQIGVFGAIITFGLTLWRMLTAYNADPFDAAVHAVLGALGVIILALLLCGIIEKLAGTPEE